MTCIIRTHLNRLHRCLIQVNIKTAFFRQLFAVSIAHIRRFLNLQKSFFFSFYQSFFSHFKEWGREEYIFLPIISYEMIKQPCWEFWLYTLHISNCRRYSVKGRQTKKHKCQSVVNISTEMHTADASSNKYKYLICV